MTNAGRLLSSESDTTAAKVISAEECIGRFGYLRFELVVKYAQGCIGATCLG